MHRVNSDSSKVFHRHHWRLELQNPHYPWSNSTSGEISVYAKGFGFLERECYVEKELACEIANRLGRGGDIAATFGNIVRSLNGSFAIVAECRGALLAAVDRLRSVPLFYGQQGSRTFISDDANWLRREMRLDKPTGLESAEFLLTGYVTGCRTLFEPIRQLQAGEYLHVINQGESSTFSCIRYYRFLHHEPRNAPSGEFKQEFDQLLVRVFERLIQSARGRTIVVPLSGGYDSRLIVSMLKRLGQQRVICYSYGTRNYWDVETSRDIAAKLGYEWKFVPYAKYRGCHWPKSGEDIEYFRYADGLCASPHIQDWMAIRAFYQTGELPADAILVPGHCGDFIAGKRFPRAWATKDGVGEGELIRSVLRRHYGLWSWQSKCPSLVDAMRQRVIEVLPPLPLDTREDVANAFECWEWQERQAKHIMHSLRVYDFYGFQWRAPLFDHELMDFFSCLPFELRLAKRFYDEFLENGLFLELGINDDQLPGTKKKRLMTFSPPRWSLFPARWRKRSFRFRRRMIRFLSEYNSTISPLIRGYPLSRRIAAVRRYSGEFGFDWTILFATNFNMFIIASCLGDIGDRVEHESPCAGLMGTVGNGVHD